jgi:hypothetical protein
LNLFNFISHRRPYYFTLLPITGIIENKQIKVIVFYKACDYLQNSGYFVWLKRKSVDLIVEKIALIALHDITKLASVH